MHGELLFRWQQAAEIVRGNEMKLTINRREEKEGLVFKKPVYYLDVDIDVTEDERALIKKHEWEGNILAKGVMKTGIVLEYSVKNMLGKNSYPFKRAEHLAYFESELIENAKILKANLEASSDFTGSGPREVEL